MKKLKPCLLFFFVFVSVVAVMSSCDNEDMSSEYVLGEKPDSIKLPFMMDQDHDSVTVVVDGKTYTITYGKRDNGKTRGIGGDKIYPRDPNATLATVPVMVSKGEYKKYAVGSYPPFAALPSNSVVLLRLDRFEFKCEAPANAKLFSFNITNITDQGFTTEDANYKGFTVDNIRSSTSGVIVNCSFYIQDGIAYNVAGQQLTKNTYYPLAGDKVRYQFTYELN